MTGTLMDRYVSVERLVTAAETSATDAEIEARTDALMPVLTALYLDAQDAHHGRIEKLSRRLIDRTIRLLRPLAEAEARHGH